MDKREAKNKSSIIKKEPEEERSHRLGACEKTLRKTI
jgi:hypothetical protein